MELNVTNVSALYTRRTFHGRAGGIYFALRNSFHFLESLCTFQIHKYKLLSLALVREETDYRYGTDRCECTDRCESFFFIMSL